MFLNLDSYNRVFINDTNINFYIQIIFSFLFNTLIFNNLIYRVLIKDLNKAFWLFL